MEADQAERPPQVFAAVRIHHMITRFEIDASAVAEAIPLSEEKYCSVGAMVQKTANFHTTYEIVEDKTDWMKTLAVDAVQRKHSGSSLPRDHSLLWCSSAPFAQNQPAPQAADEPV